MSEAQATPYPAAFDDEGGAIHDLVHTPLLLVDGTMRVVAASRSFCATFQTTSADIERRPIHDIVAERASAGGQPAARDGMVLLNLPAVFQRPNADSLILISMADLSLERAAGHALRTWPVPRTFCCRRCQHRMANTLQIVAAMLLHKVDAASSDETRSALRDAHQRLISAAAVQQALNTTDNHEPIAVAPYLNRLCRTLAESLIGDARPIELIVRADQSVTSSTQSANVARIIAELVINAHQRRSAEGSCWRANPGHLQGRRNRLGVAGRE